MRNTVLFAALTLAGLQSLSAAEWKGAGEFGLSIARGNAKTDNINGRLGFKSEDEQWKNEVYGAFLRSKGEVKLASGSVFQLSANRFELGASSGYKLDEKSYLVGSLRYENDDFAPFDSQVTVGAGYGYTFISDDTTHFSAEVGPGYRRYKPVLATAPRRIIGATKGQAILRGKADFDHKLTDNTSIVDNFLLEAGSGNKFLQNDLGLSVKMSDAFALKAGLQWRHNSTVPAGSGLKKTDTLLTTNLVYSF
jgi:putative salt-induced outer membrane protein